MKLGLVLSATDKMSRIVDQAVGKSIDKLNKLQKNANRIGGSMQKWGAGMTAAGGAITAGMFHLAKEEASLASDLSRSSQKVGMSVEAWQKIAYAASRTKVDADQFRLSLQRLQKQQVAAATGNKTAMDSFKMAGIAIYDTNGKLKSSDVLFTELADKFKNAPDGPKKTALAMRLFGKTGAELIPLLNKGSAGIDNFEKQAEELGLVMNKETIESFKKFGQESRRLKDATEGFKKVLADGALPIIHKLTAAVVRIDMKFVSFTQRHKHLVTAIIGGIATFGALLAVMGTFSIVAGTIIKSVGIITKAFQMMKFAVFALRYGFMIVSNAMKAWAIASKIVTVAQWIFNASLYGCPIVWIIAGIIAVIAAVYLIVKNWSKISAFFKKLWQNIKEIFLKVWQWIKNMFLNYTPQGLIIKHWDKIIGWFKSMVSKFKQFGIDIMKGLWEGIKSLITKPIETIKKVGEAIKNKFKSIFGIHSPSKVFAQFGISMNQGLSKGLEESKPKSIEATKNLGKSTSYAFQNSNSVNHNGITLTYAPVISLNSAMQSDRESFAKMLKDHKRELIQILKEISSNNARIRFM